MSDDELHQLLRDASPVSESQVASAALRAAQSELLEAVMALSDTDVDALIEREVALDTVAPAGRRPGRWLAVVAAVALLVALVALRATRDDDPEVVTEPPPEEPTEVPRLLFAEPPGTMTLANTMADYMTADGTLISGDGSNTGTNPTIIGYTAYYSEPTPGPDGLVYLTLSIQRADQFSMPGGPQTVPVRGHDGFVSSTDTSVQLDWLEAPDIRVTIEVINSNVTEDQVIAAAESLYEVTEWEWRQGARVNEPVGSAEMQALIPGDAQASAIAEGFGEAAYLTADGQVCAVAADGRGTMPEQCGDPTTRMHLFKDRVGMPSFVFGLLPDGATQVVPTRAGQNPNIGPDDQPLEGMVLHAPTPDGDQTLYVVRIGLPSDLLTFVDADGQPVETLPLAL